MSPQILSPNGSIFFEIGENQAHDISNMARLHNFINISIIKDLAGRDRIIYIKTDTRSS